MILGLTRAYEVFKVSKYRDLAVDAANFIWEHQRKDGNFYRFNYGGQLPVLGTGRRYALFIKALWLERATRLQTEFNGLFWDQDFGSYYNNSVQNRQNLLVRERFYLNNATPSPNGFALTNLVKLSLLTHDSKYGDLAEAVLKAFTEIGDYLLPNDSSASK